MRELILYTLIGAIVLSTFALISARRDDAPRHCPENIAAIAGCGR